MFCWGRSGQNPAEQACFTFKNAGGGSDGTEVAVANHLQEANIKWDVLPQSRSSDPNGPGSPPASRRPRTRGPQSRWCGPEPRAEDPDGPLQTDLRTETRSGCRSALQKLNLTNNFCLVSTGNIWIQHSSEWEPPGGAREPQKVGATIRKKMESNKYLCFI